MDKLCFINKETKALRCKTIRIGLHRQQTKLMDPKRLDFLHPVKTTSIAYFTFMMDLECCLCIRSALYVLEIIDANNYNNSFQSRNFRVKKEAILTSYNWRILWDIENSD